MLLNLSEIVSKNPKSALVKYDESRNVAFELKFIDKKELNRLNQQFTKMKFNPKTHQKEEELDVEALRKEICRLGVIGWKGITLRWLIDQVPIDEESIKGKDLDEEIEFSQDNLNFLCEALYGIDNWIFDSVRNAENFKAVEAQSAQIKN